MALSYLRDLLSPNYGYIPYLNASCVRAARKGSKIIDILFFSIFRCLFSIISFSRNYESGKLWHFLASNFFSSSFFSKNSCDRRRKGEPIFWKIMFSIGFTEFTEFFSIGRYIISVGMIGVFFHKDGFGLLLLFIMYITPTYRY